MRVPGRLLTVRYADTVAAEPQVQRPGAVVPEDMHLAALTDQGMGNNLAEILQLSLRRFKEKVVGADTVKGIDFYGPGICAVKPAFAVVGDTGAASTQIRASITCLLYTSPSPRDRTRSRMPSSA